MEYRNLGRTALKVSPLCLGTMNFGPVATEEECHSILDRAFDAGINFIDTANRYGRVVNMKPPEDGRPTYPGLSEEIIGSWLRKSGRRNDVVLATKLHNPMGEGPNDKGLSAYHIRQACEDSLRRLGTDHIDLYQMHHVDRSAPWEEIWQAMEQLVREGKVLYVGSSNFAAWHIAMANEAAKHRNFLGIVSEQSRYSLAARTVELEVLPACQHLGVGVMPWGPLQSGLLAGMLEKAEAGGTSSRGLERYVEQFRSQLEPYEELCREIGEAPAHVGLAWLLHNPAVTAPVIGPRTVEQLENSLRAPEISLTDEVMKRLDKIWPGPGGAAPEAYAW